MTTRKRGTGGRFAKPVADATPVAEAAEVAAEPVEITHNAPAAVEDVAIPPEAAEQAPARTRKLVRPYGATNIPVWEQGQMAVFAVSRPIGACWEAWDGDVLVCQERATRADSRQVRAKVIAAAEAALAAASAPAAPDSGAVSPVTPE